MVQTVDTGGHDQQGKLWYRYCTLWDTINRVSYGIDGGHCGTRSTV